MKSFPSAAAAGGGGRRLLLLRQHSLVLTLLLSTRDSADVATDHLLVFKRVTQPFVLATQLRRYQVTVYHI